MWVKEEEEPEVVTSLCAGSVGAGFLTCGAVSVGAVIASVGAFSSEEIFSTTPSVWVV